MIPLFLPDSRDVPLPPDLGLPFPRRTVATSKIQLPTAIHPVESSSIDLSESSSSLFTRSLVGSRMTSVYLTLSFVYSFHLCPCLASRLFARWVYSFARDSGGGRRLGRSRVAPDVEADSREGEGKDGWPVSGVEINHAGAEKTRPRCKDRAAGIIPNGSFENYTSFSRQPSYLHVLRRGCVTSAGPAVSYTSLHQST